MIEGLEFKSMITPVCVPTWFNDLTDVHAILIGHVADDGEHRKAGIDAGEETHKVDHDGISETWHKH